MGQGDYLQIKRINKSFGDVKAVNNITVNIGRGELVSFIGPSGCGKTTLLRIIGGFYEQDQGTIILDGQSIDHLPPEQRLTGMVFQNYALFPHMTVEQNVEYGLKNKKVSKEERKKRVQKALKQVQLEGYDKRKPSELSGGQQQRVAIARCLVLEPKVLLLDEPLSNLDANLRMVMREEIRRLKEELDLTIIFVTHDQEEALSISDRIVVLKEGTIQQIDEPEKIYNEPANDFVAHFVGHANLLEGSIETKGNVHYFNGGKGIQFQVKQLPSDQTKSVKLMVRPEQIAIDQNSPLKGKIIRTLYNGNYIRYYVMLWGTEIMVDVFNGPLYEEGELIGLVFPEMPHYIEEKGIYEKRALAMKS